MGAVIILVPIFVFWTALNINKQKESTSLLLLEKGAALIRSFEAGTRTGMLGMMGMQGGRFQLQKLLTETAQLPDIVYLIVTDKRGMILAHNERGMIGQTHGRDMDLEKISKMREEGWRVLSIPERPDIFEVFRRFSPDRRPFPGHRELMNGILNEMGIKPLTDEEYIIFVGLNMGPVEEARKEGTRHTIFMAIILLLIGFTGIFSLFVVQAYQTAKTSLKRIKALSDNVVENMPIGLLVLEKNGSIASINETAELLLKLQSREIIGKSADNVLPRELSSIIGETGNRKKIIEREIDCRLKDGQRLPLDVTFSILKGEDGIFMGYLFLLRDLTEVRELKKEIDRSRRLASLGRLAAGIAHEIRNPLSSIKGFATYFKDRYKDIAEDRKTAEIMIHEVERLNRVVGQLLEFARPLEIVLKPVPVKILIDHSLKMIEGLVREKNIKINLDIPPENPLIPMDQDRMNQVMLNLYLNAIESMIEGGSISVKVSLSEDAGRIAISVSDTGVGIKKEDLVHVFDPYFTTKQTGTGLGLAIVHKIIESHDGEIRVESTEDRGTKVSILLPFDNSERSD